MSPLARFTKYAMVSRGIMNGLSLYQELPMAVMESVNSVVSARVASAAVVLSGALKTETVTPLLERKPVTVLCVGSISVWVNLVSNRSQLVDYGWILAIESPERL